MQNILVTGANGFIGKVICKMLFDAGYKVFAVKRSGFEKNLQYIEGNISIDSLDSFTDWKGKINNIDCIVHLAARVHVMDENSHDPLKEYMDVNYSGTLNLAKEAKNAKVKRFIYISTIKVNGEKTGEIAFKADDTPNPTDAYAKSKFRAENELLLLGEKSGMEVTVIRPPLVYGPGVKGNFIKLLKIVEYGVPIPFLSVKNLRSFVSVVNISSFIMRCIEHKNAVGQIFIVSDNADISTPDLMRKISTAMGKPIRLLPVPLVLLKLTGKLIRKNSAFEKLYGSLVVDVNKARKLLNWEPLQTFDEGIRQTVEWYQKNKND